MHQCVRNAIHRGRETILVVDDTVEVRRMTCEALESHGYTVLEAADGHEALEVFEANQNGIHLLLTDVVMPRMNGGELAERIRRINPRLRMIFMSGYTHDPCARQAAQLTTFLPKPFTSNTLTRTVRELLDAE